MSLRPEPATKLRRRPLPGSSPFAFHLLLAPQKFGQHPAHLLSLVSELAAQQA